MANVRRAKHDSAVLEEAAEAVKSKRMALRKAAKHYGIAVSTLGDKVSGRTPLVYVPHSLLTASEEDRLYQWLLQMSELGFGQTTDDIRAKVKQIIELRPENKNQGDSQENEASSRKLPSPSWVTRFFERHPRITLRSPLPLGKERALVTPIKVKDWFEGLQNYINAKDPSLLIDSTRIFNSDESGFSFNPKQRKVIAWKGAKNVYSVTSNTRTQVTVLATMSAAGFYLPPLLIYPYKRPPGKDLMAGFREAELHVSDNGWITSAIFYTWLRDSFIPATKHIKKPLLLLVDGHVSHTSLVETSQICEENGIILYCLLAHASHLIQPLDQAFFASVKAAWSQASKRHIAETGDAVNLETFAQVLKPVWDSSATLKIAESSFRAAGIFPFSPDRVLSTKKMQPCQVYRQTPPETSTSEEDPAPASSSEEEPVPPAPFLYITDDEEEPMSPAPLELPSLRRNRIIMQQMPTNSRPQHHQPVHSRPQHHQPVHSRPQHHQPVHSRPQHHQPVHSRPQHHQPVHSRPQHHQPGHSRPQHHQPAHSRPQHHQPVHSRPQHHQPVHSRLQHHQPVHSGPRSVAPVSSSPGRLQ